MSSNPTPPHADLAQPKKLRLNSEQWQTLQALADGSGSTDANGHMPGLGRLTSHGLVAMDQGGCAYLTIFGLERLNQGP